MQMVRASHSSLVAGRQARLSSASRPRQIHLGAALWCSLRLGLTNRLLDLGSFARSQRDRDKQDEVRPDSVQFLKLKRRYFVASCRKDGEQAGQDGELLLLPPTAFSTIEVDTNRLLT